MRTNGTLLLGSIAATILLSTTSASATNSGSVSAGAFKSVSSVDVPYIYNYGEYLGNSDPSASHGVTAHLGLYNGIADAAAFKGINNGGTVSCTVFVVAESNIALHTSYTNSTTAIGPYSFTVNIPASLPAPAVLSANCTIPPHNSSGDSQLWMAQ